MDKRDFIMSIARDLTVEVIKCDKHFLECISRNNAERALLQAETVKDLYSAMVDGVSSIYEGNKSLL